MREWEIGAVENIHGALPYIRFAPILALVGVGVNRIGKVRCSIDSRLFPSGPPHRVSARVIENTDRETLHGFVGDHAAGDATVYTDDHKGYSGMPFDHETVKHSVSEYVWDQAHTNGIESFWATLKRGYHGTFHHISPKHLHRYVNEFATRHNMRPKDTEAMMAETVARMVGKRLMYKELVAG